ncbi:MAG: leucine-rich repeat domain-containing protein, partial [Muribaculaceae bacterium]|nr:leucine-rich repeat domain-containing protein [Muribaculaceae bacterium]
MKIKTMQGLLLAGSLIGGVSYAHAMAIPTEVRAESPEVTWMTINLETAGTLGVEILYKTDNLSDVTHLRVTGHLNTKDWVTISNLSSIVELDLSGASSATVGVPVQTFVSRTSLKKISLPLDIPSIGNDAFSYSGIEEIIIPSSVKSIGDRAFMSCASLVLADIPGVETIPDHCFSSCSKLQVVKLHPGVKYLSPYVFHSCSSLEAINLPEGLLSVGYSCFQATSSLKELIFPSSITSLDRYLINGSGITKIDLGTGQVQISRDAISGCSNLEEIILPGGTPSYLDFANYCAALKRVVCRAVTPPVMNNCFSAVNWANVEVVVPEFAVVSYKIDNYWGKTGTIKGGAMSNEWIIGSDLDLLSGHRMEGTPSVAIIEGGKLNVLGSDPMPMEKFSVRSNLNSKVYGQFINAAALMTANATELSFYAYPNRWYFISFPCDVKLSEITHSESRDFIFRSYDGESRALNGTGASWKDVPAEGTLEAGKGYIFQTQGAGYLTAPLSQAAGAKLMRAADRTIKVKAWNSETAENQGWNFIGNPYPSYYDMYASSLSTPITVWDGSKYVAYSLADDDVILEPMQGFFMQQAD